MDYLGELYCTFQVLVVDQMLVRGQMFLNLGYVLELLIWMCFLKILMAWFYF